MNDSAPEDQDQVRDSIPVTAGTKEAPQYSESTPVSEITPVKEVPGMKIPDEVGEVGARPEDDYKVKIDPATGMTDSGPFMEHPTSPSGSFTSISGLSSDQVKEEIKEAKESIFSKLLVALRQLGRRKSVPEGGTA